MIKNLVFDFGGVIVDINRENAVKRFEAIGVSNAEELLDKYHQKGIFLEVENGRITAEEFCKKLGKMCGKEISYEEARQAWLSFFVNDPQYRLDYIAELRKKYKVYILSNTNPFVMSWARSPEFTSQGKPLDDYADKLYLSYQVRQVKPDKEIFEYMIKDANLNPDETLFIDDGAANVKMGRELGFLTLQPINGKDWRGKLSEMLQY
ncbi:HAD family phosphatase [Bacteroides sp. 224]|uniref:HAD family hydrolase n=1 Tax=Bacteroides sp. 224 TaxID=2302936 RepID=UPI0013D3A753|nr:HAD family phosphatase [Bacteroides sp. 224]NDV64787.1 HAD family phosphatase [Bacteroides sp. 224]